MARLTKDEILSQLSEFIGDDSSDAAISLMENISDTLDPDTEDWKSKYDELDASWRKRYMERFSNIATEKDTSVVIQADQDTTSDNTDTVDESDGTIVFDDLGI